MHEKYGGTPPYAGKTGFNLFLVEFLSGVFNESESGLFSTGKYKVFEHPPAPYRMQVGITA